MIIADKDGRKFKISTKKINCRQDIEKHVDGNVCNVCKNSGMETVINESLLSSKQRQLLKDLKIL